MRLRALRLGIALTITAVVPAVGQEDQWRTLLEKQPLTANIVLTQLKEAKGEIWVQLDGEVICRNRTPSPKLLWDMKIQVWLLQADGSTLKQKRPPSHVAWGNAGCVANPIQFSFEAAGRDPIGVAISIDGAMWVRAIPSAVSDDAKQLLATLRQRLDEIAAASESRLKPGGDLDLRPLIGLQVKTLRDALGPASINCRDKSTINVTTGERERIAPCRADDDLVYSFYRLPKGTGGGGPELLLQFDQKGICIRALWRMTQ